MPQHVQPLLRFKEEVEETLGYIEPLDSVLVTNYKAQESQKLKAKPLPAVIYATGNSTYTPS